MPTDGPRTVVDFANNTIDDGISLDLDHAGAFLRRLNLVDNSALNDLRPNNDPRFYQTFEGPQDQGTIIYATKADGATSEMYQYNSEPYDPEIDTIQLLHPITEAAGPLSRGDREAFPLRNQLEAPTLEAVATDIVGLPPGKYLMTWTCGDGSKRQTLPLNAVEFTIADEAGTTGKAIRATLIPDPPEGTEFQYLYITEPRGFEADGTTYKEPILSTLKQQAKVPSGRRFYEFMGPYDHGGRKVPTVNETKIGKSKEPRRPKDFKKVGHRVHDMQEFLNLQVYFVESSPRGDGIVSSGSKIHDFAADKNHCIRFTPERRGFHPSTTGYKIFVTYGNGGTFYRLIRRGAKRADPFKLDAKPELFRTYSEEPTYYPTRKRKKNKNPRLMSHYLIQEDPNTEEDVSGIEDPSGDPEVPVVFGPSRPGAGTYYVRYARVFDGKISWASPFRKVTITGTQVIEVTLPEKINRIANAQFRTVGKNRRPTKWVWTLTTSSLLVEEAIAKLTTTSTIVAAGTFPSGQSYPILAKPNRIETIRGYLGLENRTAGTGYATIQQFSNTAGTTNLNLDLSLGTISQNGQINLDQKIGPGQALTLDPDCRSIRLIWGLSGANRNATVYAHSLALHPFDGKPRRFDFPHNGAAEPMRTTTDPAAKYPARSVVGAMTGIVETGSSPATAPEPAIETNNFEAALPAGYFSERDPVATTTEAQRVADSSIQGSWLYRARVDYTGTTSLGDVWLRRDLYTYPPAGYGTADPNPLWEMERLADRFRMKITRGPTVGGSYASFAYAQNATADNIMIYNIRIRNTGTDAAPVFSIEMQAGGKNVFTGWYLIKSGLHNGDIVDCEFKVRGLNSSSTSAGEVEGSVTFGGVKSTVTLTGRNFQYNALDWTYKGSFTRSSSSTKTTLDFDEYYLSENGYGVINVPPMADIEESDYPRKTVTPLYQSTSTLTYTAPAVRSQMGAYARSTHTATLPATDSEILRLANSGNTTAYATLIKRTTGQVDLIVAGNTYPIFSPVQSGTWEFDVRILGSGTAAATVYCYYKRPTETQWHLRAIVTGVDLSTASLQRALTVAATGVTHDELIVTDKGIVEMVDTYADGSSIYQGYAFAYPPTAFGDGRLGLEVEEFFVRPGVAQTVFAWMAWEDLNVADSPDPLIPVLYNEDGEPLFLESLAGADGTGVSVGSAQVASSDWVDRWYTFTPPPGYYRLRIENRHIWQGSIRWQLPGVAPGTLNTQAARDAVRTNRRKLHGVLRQTLRARIPDQSLLSESYGETWEEIGVPVHNVLAQDVQKLDLSVNASTDVLTAVNHTFETDSLVRIEGDVLPGGISDGNKLFVRDVSGDTFKVALTAGGTAINITSTGTNVTVREATKVEVWYRSSNDPDALVWTPASYTQDLEQLIEDAAWVDFEVHLYGGGLETPQVPAGSWVTYKTVQPILCREDRTPLPGGVVVGNHSRAFTSPDYRNDAPGGHSRPIPITDELGRWRGGTLTTFHPDAENELSEDFLRFDWVIEDWTFNEVIKIRPYEMFEFEQFETDLFESATGYLPPTYEVGRAEVIENGYWIEPE